MSIYRKTLIIYFFFLIFGFIFVMLFSIQTDNPLRTYFVIISLFALGDILFLKIKTRIYRYFYKKYINIINEELDPERFISLTENEYNSVKNKKYRNYMKINFSLGYITKGNMERAYDYLMDVEISGNIGIAKADKAMYYHNLILVLYSLDRKQEAVKIYNEFKEIYVNELKHKNKRKEMKNLIEYIELLLFHGDKYEEIIEAIEKTLKMDLSKRIKISLKYDLAVFKEKIGETEQAEKLYKEVVEKGNKLYIKEKAIKELVKFVK